MKMDSATFGTVKEAIQTLFATFSFIINSFLIYLIINKSTKKMGNYRHLMIFFCCFSIFFSAMDVIVRPVMYSHGSAFCMMMDLQGRLLPIWVGRLLICMMSGCFGAVIYGIAIHFIYRYFALERHGRLRYFQIKYLPLWFSIPLIGFIIWSLISWHLLPMNPLTSEYIRPTIAESFGMNVNQTVYTGALFLVPSENGSLVYNWKCAFGFLSFLLLMSIPFATVMFVGVKSYGKIKELPASKYGLCLQVQLYKALVAQTLIPVFLLFIPFAVIFICPFLKIDCDLLTTSSFFVYAVYPAVDPLPNIFYIASYRKSAIKFFRCDPCRKSRVHISSESDTSRETNSF